MLKLPENQSLKSKAVCRHFHIAMGGFILCNKKSGSIPPLFVALKLLPAIFDINIFCKI